MKWLHRYLWKRRRQRALRNIRREFAFWGIFMVNLTDDQLEKRIIDTADMFGGISYTTEDVLQAMRKMLI